MRVIGVQAMPIDVNGRAVISASERMRSATGSLAGMTSSQHSRVAERLHSAVTGLTVNWTANSQVHVDSATWKKWDIFNIAESQTCDYVVFMVFSLEVVMANARISCQCLKWQRFERELLPTRFPHVIRWFLDTQNKSGCLPATATQDKNKNNSHFLVDDSLVWEDCELDWRKSTKFWDRIEAVRVKAVAKNNLVPCRDSRINHTISTLCLSREQLDIKSEIVGGAGGWRWQCKLRVLQRYK